MNLRRIRQVLEYGKKDAEAISQMPDVHLSKSAIFRDILSCFFKYNLWSNQYKKEKLYSLDEEQKTAVCLKYKEKNDFRDQWVKEFFDNYKFLDKWSSFKYETSAVLQEKRREAYKKQYGLGDNCFVGYDVIFHKHHYQESKIETGKNCLIAEHVNIDYTGGLYIGNKVSISEGAKILTHNHVVNFSGKDEDKGCINTPLIIRDRVWIGTKAIIMPGVGEIGRGAMISSDAFVRTEIPPYAIVMGNPAKIVGFRLTPKEVEAFEKENYNEDERTPMDVLVKNYDTYFVKRWKEIKEFTRIKV